MSPETLLTTLGDFTPLTPLAESKPRQDPGAFPTPALSRVQSAVSPVDLF